MNEKQRCRRFESRHLDSYWLLLASFHFQFWTKLNAPLPDERLPCHLLMGMTVPSIASAVIRHILQPHWPQVSFFISSGVQTFRHCGHRKAIIPMRDLRWSSVRVDPRAASPTGLLPLSRYASSMITKPGQNITAPRPQSQGRSRLFRRAAM